MYNQREEDDQWERVVCSSTARRERACTQRYAVCSTVYDEPQRER